MSNLRRLNLFFVLIIVPILWGLSSLFDAWFLLQAVYFLLPFMLLASLVAFMARRRPDRIRMEPALVAFLVYDVVLVITTLMAQVSNDWSMPLFKWLTMSIVWSSVFIIGILLVPNDEDIVVIDKFLGILSAILVLSVCLTLIFPSFGEVQGGEGRGTRYFGPFGDSVGFSLAFFCLRALARKNWASLAVCSFALFLTGTRGALLVVAAGLVLFTLFPLPGRTIEIRRTVMFGAVLVLIVLFAAWESDYGYAIERMFDREEFIRSNRAGSVQLGWNVFTDNFLVGVGYMGFTQKAWQYNPEAVFGSFAENFIANTSNQLLQTATDGGIVALTVFVTFWVLWFFKAKSVVQSAQNQEVARHLHVYSVGIGALLIGNQTAAWLLPDSLMAFMYLFLAGVLISYRSARSHRTAPVQPHRARPVRPVRYRV